MFHKSFIIKVTVLKSNLKDMFNVPSKFHYQSQDKFPSQSFSISVKVGHNHNQSHQCLRHKSFRLL